MPPVDVGFAEKCEPWLLHNCFFPSKVGGKPAWLNFKNIPEEINCKYCKAPMAFLCQVYAPFEDNDNCFHRTLFLFTCRASGCCRKNDSGNMIVFRSQLGRYNDYYPFVAPDETKASCFDVTKYIKLCYVCGCVATKHCGSCKRSAYCSREHQLADWRAGHKRICHNLPPAEYEIPSVVFPEFELIIEEEEMPKPLPETEEEAEKRCLKEYKELVEANKAGTLPETPESELESYAAVEPDKTFMQFRKSIAKSPDQVIRYERGGTPLWIAKDPRPTVIPQCEACGSNREFEFQILPQMLNKLNEENLDWGVLNVYTCKDSCDFGGLYGTEYIFKQDVADNVKKE